MTKPWLAIPLEDYEGHMQSPGVEQLVVLAELFEAALRYCAPESVAVLGVAGGNGLERVDSKCTRRVVGVDFHAGYLRAVQQRFSSLPGLELHCCDLAEQELPVQPVALVHVALLFEHAGLEQPLRNAVRAVAAGGAMSVVLQLPSTEQAGVAPTPFASLQTLKEAFQFIDVDAFRARMSAAGFALEREQRRNLPGGKGFWMGLFRNTGAAITES